MSRISPIRTDADHKAALARIDALMDAAAGTPEADELTVLAELVETYEAKRFPIELPTPIDAIKFRMEQAGLKPKDLEPYIGSRGKVSGVLSGKHPLTLPMIRALHQHLGIPSDVLLQDSRDPSQAVDPSNDFRLDWPRFPLNELMKRGWIEKVSSAKSRAEDLICTLIASAGGRNAVPAPLCRRNDAMRQNAKTNIYALLAWCLKVTSTAKAETLEGQYQKGVVSPDFLFRLAKLSAFADGPKRAKSELSKVGIHLVCVRHLQKTYLDGAALMNLDTGSPIVALTLRYDRVDNFWFSLLHELAHVGRHFKDSADAFIDDFSLRELPSRHEDPREEEADTWANDALIPSGVWENSGLQTKPSYTRIIAFSQQIGIHPAIVAGRIRHLSRDFRAFAPLLGTGEVRKQLNFVE